jgi:monoamine oxidase
MVLKKPRIQATRRAVMTGGAAALLAASAPSLASTRRQNGGTTVIVIGAGMAGLAAARDLQQRGYSVTIIEAANRIGGRIRTDRSLGAPFEMGAGWIHGPRGNPVTSLAEAAGATTFVTHDERYRVFDSAGAPVPRADIELGWQRLQRIHGRIDDNLETDVSLADALARYGPGRADDPVVNWMHSAYTEFDTGGSLDQLSAMQFDEDEAFAGADVVLPGGYDRILAPIAEGLDIRLGHRVGAIGYGPAGVRIETSQGVFEAAYAVSTLPLGVMRAGDVRFDPPLPGGYGNRMDRIGIGQVTKIALKFDHAFWPLDDQYFGLMTHSRGRWNYWMNCRTFGSQNILVGVSVGDYAARVEREDDDQVRADAMQAIRTMFGAGAPSPVGMRVSRWSEDPLSRGAYSFAKLGVRRRDFDRLAAPVDGRLFLAGEHTIFDYHGTVHGAYLSGVRAAEWIAEGG